MNTSAKECKGCQSCLMPFEKDPGVREHPHYCSLCYGNGDFYFKGNLKDFQKLCYEKMVESGMSRFKARFFSWMIRFAPRWKQKSK